MGTKGKYDPWTKVRKPIPRPGHAINHAKTYNRNKQKQLDREIIEEDLEDMETRK